MFAQPQLRHDWQGFSTVSWQKPKTSTDLIRHSLRMRRGSSPISPRTVTPFRLGHRKRRSSISTYQLQASSYLGYASTGRGAGDLHLLPLAPPPQAVTPPSSSSHSSVRTAIISRTIKAQVEYARACGKTITAARARELFKLERVPTSHHHHRPPTAAPSSVASAEMKREVSWIGSSSSSGQNPLAPSKPKAASPRVQAATFGKAQFCTIDSKPQQHSRNSRIHAWRLSISNEPPLPYQPVLPSLYSPTLIAQKRPELAVSAPRARHIGQLQTTSQAPVLFHPQVSAMPLPPSPPQWFHLEPATESHSMSASSTSGSPTFGTWQLNPPMTGERMTEALLCERRGRRLGPIKTVLARR